MRGAALPLGYGALAVPEISHQGGRFGNVETMSESAKVHRRHPPWLKVKAPFGKDVHRLRRLLKGLNLNTVCQEAVCPNVGECWAHGVATFMILGDICTRGCRYCAVTKGRPEPLDWEEPSRVASAVAVMNLSHVVITSVNRDELEDGGAGIFAETIRQIRGKQPGCSIEVLVPDFKGSEESVRTVLKQDPEIFSHNIETVPRLYRRARGGGKYDVSLKVLELAKEINPHQTTKTGLMLGLGEEAAEVRAVMRDLVSRKVNILTLGQYLRPSRWHLPVERYCQPQEFDDWKREGESLGFDYVESGPLVRSSYMADRQFKAVADRLTVIGEDLGTGL